MDEENSTTYVDGWLWGLLRPDVAETFSELVEFEAKLQPHLAIGSNRKFQKTKNEKIRERTANSQKMDATHSLVFGER